MITTPIRLKVERVQGSWRHELELGVFPTLTRTNETDTEPVGLNQLRTTPTGNFDLTDHRGDLVARFFEGRWLVPDIEGTFDRLFVEEAEDKEGKTSPENRGELKTAYEYSRVHGPAAAPRTNGGLWHFFLPDDVVAARGALAGPSITLDELQWSKMGKPVRLEVVVRAAS